MKGTDMQGIFEKIKESFEEVAWWTPSTFDCDGYSNDDSEEVITLDRAIEIVNQVEEEYAKTPTPNHPIPIDTQMYIAELEKKDGWIPVSERLPKYIDDYNVTVGVGNPLGYYETVMTFRFERIGNREPKWIIPNDFNNIYTVIAWQPLPEPYRPKG